MSGTSKARAAGDKPRRVRANDWSVLTAPRLGAWSPTLSVSIVVPAFRAEQTLGQTLASLSGQTYPEHLLEVVVVDDDGGLILPAVRPARTKLIRPEASWGRANACAAGAEHSDGDVIHWLDADMLVHRSHIEAQMRWHHLIDYAVVLGHKVFVDAEVSLPAPIDVRTAVKSDAVEALLGERWSGEHEWVERFWVRTKDLTSAGFRAHQVHVGATASVGRGLYKASGGMDRRLKRGEDIELGFRLSSRGGVFIAERDARSWHLGRSTLMQDEQAVTRYNFAYLAHALPDLRKLRRPRGRSYRVPAYEVVVDARQKTYEEVRYSVDGVLGAIPGDVSCLVVGPWSTLDDARRSPLTDSLLDYRLLAAEYDPEPRVELVESVPESSYPAMLRMRLPAGWRPAPSTMTSLLRDMQKRSEGLRHIMLGDGGGMVRVERTAAVERAHRVKTAQEPLDDVLEAVSFAGWFDDGAKEWFEGRHDNAGPNLTSI